MKRDAIRLAAETELDPRTCERAIRLGAKALRAERDRRVATEAAERLGLTLGAHIGDAFDGGSRIS